MISDELAIYKEIYKKDGLLETNLETFKISNCSDCLKLMMAHYYQNNTSSLPMYELEYLNSLRHIEDLTFAALDKKLLKDIKKTNDQKNSFIERQSKLSTEINTNLFDKQIEALIQIQRTYHTLMLNQVTKSTGIKFNEETNSIVDLRKQEGIFNQKLEEMYYNGELSILLYQAMKRTIREKTESIISTFGSNENEKSSTHL